ncbi:MAG: hypothetical protein M8862_02370 [marine benthic group bacterium]|nr:hypothetical protein [Gemmatimonadota bacterium]
MRRRLLSCALSAVLAVTLAAGPVGAQDAQYWTNDYGNRARLLGGAMVGSASDLSAVYYNPGRLALLEEPEAFLSGFVFNYDHLRAENSITPGDELTSSRFDAVAALIAGELRLGFLGDSHLAYSFMNRHGFDIRLKEEVIYENPDLPGLPDVELLAGNLGFETKLSEYWAGLTWAKPLGNGLGLGVSTFVSVRNQRSRRNVDLQGLSNEGEATVVNSLRDYRYDSWRVLPKVGLSWEDERVSLGIAVTAPGIRLFGSGDETVSQYVVSQVESPTGPIPPELAVHYEEGIPAKFNSPWSVAAGAAYGFSENTRAHASLEWFDANRRTILAVEPFTPQTGGESIDPSVYLEMKPVMNVALGAEHQFDENLTGYGSFRTDFSGAESPIPTETTFAIWDLYHIGAGVQANVKRSDFTLGLVYSRGSATRPSPLTGLGFGDGQGILSSETGYTFSRITLLLGFQLAFAPDLSIG